MTWIREWLTTDHVWLIIGLIGQSMFFGRFLIQWISSERAKKSVIPVSFWYFSIVGGIVVLAYSLYKQDPVFIIGQSTGVIIYSRNLYFIFRERARAKAGASVEPA